MLIPFLLLNMSDVVSVIAFELNYILEHLVFKLLIFTSDLIAFGYFYYFKPITIATIVESKVLNINIESLHSFIFCNK